MRILEATCDETGKVFVGETEITDARLTSNGAQASQGILILDGDLITYITSSVTDISTTIEKTALALGEIASALTAMDAKPVGGTGSAPAPVAAGNVANIQTAKADLESLKGALK